MPSSASDSGAWRYFPVAGKPLISDTLQEQWVSMGSFLQRPSLSQCPVALTTGTLLEQSSMGFGRAGGQVCWPKCFLQNSAMDCHGCLLQIQTRHAASNRLDWNHCGLSPFSDGEHPSLEKDPGWVVFGTIADFLLVLRMQRRFGCLWICFLLVKAYDSWCWHQSNFVAVPSCSCASFLLVPSIPCGRWAATS